MTITVTRDRTGRMRHVAQVRAHRVPVEDTAVTVERDDADERKGTYRLRTSLALSGPLTPAQRGELLAVARKCPVHKLMTQATTDVVTELAFRGG